MKWNVDDVKLMAADMFSECKNTTELNKNFVCVRMCVRVCECECLHTDECYDFYDRKVWKRYRQRENVLCVCVCVRLKDGEQEIGDGVKEVVRRRKSITHKYIYCIQIKCKQTDLGKRGNWLVVDNMCSRRKSERSVRTNEQEWNRRKLNVLWISLLVYVYNLSWFLIMSPKAPCMTIQNLLKSFSHQTRTSHALCLRFLLAFVYNCGVFFCYIRAILTHTPYFVRTCVSMDLCICAAATFNSILFIEIFYTNA